MLISILVDLEYVICWSLFMLSINALLTVWGLHGQVASGIVSKRDDAQIKKQFETAGILFCILLIVLYLMHLFNFPLPTS